MEQALAILMVLGIFIGIPAVIGFAIVGGTVLAARRRRARVRPAERAEAKFEAAPEAERAKRQRHLRWWT